MNVRKTITTSALALGVLAGAAGIASAVSAGPVAPQDSSSTAESDQTQEPMLNGSIQVAEIEGQSEADESAALASHATISADEASQAALAANPGATVKDTQLENENGSVVYEVDMTDASGTSLEVKVDAGDGAVLAQESGRDNETGEGADDDGADDEANEGPEADEAPEVTPAN